MSRGSTRRSRIDEVLAGAEVLADEYEDFDERAALDRIARRVVWDSASDLEDRARWFRTASGAAGRASDGIRCDVPAALHERAAHELQALCSHVVRDPAAIAAMALLVDDRATIEPGGALTFACLLYLAERHEAAQFWWQFAAGADSSTAAHCLYLHHLQYSELRDAGLWYDQTRELRRLDDNPMLQVTPPQRGDSAWPWSPRTVTFLAVYEVDDSAADLDDAGTPLLVVPLSDSLAEAVRRLEADNDVDYGTIPKPDPDLAAELEDCVVSGT
ncbi:hypothetical protein [Streptomyces sp. NPDC093591]|uniref:hypothetical protein n=1 Tax=Streptomyces sp. NPDC093591 TaxID=3366044 RepID=UPI00381890FC